MQAGMELAKDDDSPDALAQAEFTQSLQPLPSAAQLWAVRQKKLSLEDIKLRQRERGDICAVYVHISSRRFRDPIYVHS